MKSVIRNVNIFMAMAFVVIALAHGARAQTSDAWIDVTAAPYSAACNGSHDDTAAFQNALSAAFNNGGGVVLVPSTVTGACIITGQLVLDGYRNVTLMGQSNAGDFGQTFEFSFGTPTMPITKAIIRFTGSSSPLISMKSTNGIKLRGLAIDQTNSSFTGMIVDLEHSSTGGDTQGAIFEDLAFNGFASSGTGAACAICGDKADVIFIDRCSFSNMVTAIQGLASSSDYAVNWTISRSSFSNISGPYITNTGGWNIGPGNTFEMYDNNGANTSGAIIDNTNGNQYSGVSFFNNWVGDTNLPNGGTFFKNMQNNFNLRDNGISGNFNTNNISLVSFASGISGVNVTGNSLAQFNTVFTFNGSNQTEVFIRGNSYNIGGGTFVNLASGTPASGTITDNVNNTAFYGLTNFYGATGVGNLWVNGTLFKPAGEFRIDHPLDPANEYLSHSFVESPDMMNIYNGIVRLDSHGRALVKLPAYFEALNQDFRYQLTTIGGSAPVYIAREIHGNNFVIAGGRPGLKVSWQVTGIRHDAYANEHRIVVEEEKSPNAKGHYLHPELFGQPADKTIQLPASGSDSKAKRDLPKSN